MREIKNNNIDEMGKYLFSEKGKCIAGLKEFEDGNKIEVSVYEKAIVINDISDDSNNSYLIKNDDIIEYEVVTETKMREKPSLMKVAILGFWSLHMRKKDSKNIILKVGKDTITYKANMNSIRVAQRIEKIIEKRKG